MIPRGLHKSVSDDVLRDGAVLVTGASTVVGRLLLHFLGEEDIAAVGLARSAASAKRRFGFPHRRTCAAAGRRRGHRYLRRASGGTLGIGLPEIIGHQFVIRGVVFARWFFDVPREERVADIQAALELAAQMPVFFKASGVYSLSNFQEAILAVNAPDRNGFVFFKPYSQQQFNQ